jgi:hypothetical protein
VHQAKYTKDLIKKFNMVELKPMSTRMSSTTSLGLDEDGEAVDLTMTRPDIQFSVGLCARFQASPRSSHQMAVQ